MNLQRNVWYVAAWPEEVTRTPLGRTIVDELIVFYRTEAGDPVAIGRGISVDQRTTIHWHPGQVIYFEEITVPSGQPFPMSTNMRFSHIATPASKNQTHYFFRVSRSFDMDNAELDAAIRNFQRNVIEQEDGKMLRAIDCNMMGKDLADKRPLFLKVDAGAMRVRGVMERLLSADESTRQNGIRKVTIYAAPGEDDGIQI